MYIFSSEVEPMVQQVERRERIDDAARHRATRSILRPQPRRTLVIERLLRLSHMRGRLGGLPQANRSNAAATGRSLPAS